MYMCARVWIYTLQRRLSLETVPIPKPMDPHHTAFFLCMPTLSWVPFVRYKFGVIRQQFQRKNLDQGNFTLD